MWGLGDVTMACWAKLQCEGVKHVSKNLVATSKLQMPEWSQEPRDTLGTKKYQHYHTNFNHLGDLVPGICSPLLCKILLVKIGFSPSLKIHLKAVLGMLMLSVSMAVD